MTCSPQRSERAAGSFLVAVVAFVAPASAELPSAQRQAELARLVRQDCGSCHGLTLGGGLGKPLLPDALSPLSPEQIAAVILEGMPGTPMPPWKGLLTSDDAAWIATRLKEGFPP